jgi:hypothetical protein
VQATWVEELFDLPHGMPFYDTFRRVLSLLDPEKLTQWFLAWIQALHAATDGDIVAIDGKTLRRFFDQASSQSAIHMVSAWAQANRLVLGQPQVADKSNEIMAVPQLLRLLHLEGCTVTIDAMGCQKDIALIMSWPSKQIMAISTTMSPPFWWTSELRVLSLWYCTPTKQLIRTMAMWRRAPIGSL